MWSHKAKRAPQAVQRLNHARNEPGVRTIARVDLTDCDFQAANQRFGFLSFLVGHGRSPR
jgi:hypothetical protein